MNAMALSVGERMARVRNKNTAPELAVRRLLARSGVRYRLHRRDLPGTPDVYVPRLGLAIFVHGCFWHGHSCRRGTRPKSNVSFWNAKIATNVARDRAVRKELTSLGIAAVELWTCSQETFAETCARIARQYRRARRS